MKQAFIAALSALVLSHVPVAKAQSPQPVTWKLATGYRAESFHTQNIAQFASEVSVASAGQLTVEVFPNGTLAKLADISQAVRDGKAQAGETIMSSMVKDISTAGAESVPFVVISYSDEQRLLKLERHGIEKLFTERSIKLLYAVPWPPQGLHSSKPVRSLADFKGTKMRIYNSTMLRIAELLGAKPVDMVTADVGKALAEGRMDNMITSALTGVENKVWSQIKYYYEINASLLKNVVFVSSKAFEALKPDLRSAVLKAAGDADIRGQAASEAMATSATEELRANGVKIERIPADVDLEIKRIGEKFSREWVSSLAMKPTPFLHPTTLSNQLSKFKQ